jgi:hypothetical protein
MVLLESLSAEELAELAGLSENAGSPEDRALVISARALIAQHLAEQREGETECPESTTPKRSGAG